MVDSATEEARQSIRKAIRELCASYPDSYWRRLDKERTYPEEFVKSLTDAGWLSVLIPEKYGGAGLGMTEAAIILEEINRSGGTATAAHAQMYTMGALLSYGNDEQKERWLTKMAKGELRLQSFAITEPTSGSDTTNITTLAEKKGGKYHLRGIKVFTSRVQHSDLMMILVRTTPREKVQKKTEGMTLLIGDMRDPNFTTHIRVTPIETMVNHETNEVFFDDAEVPIENVIGEEGRGFGYVLSGINAERILVASECIGDGLFFVDRSVSYATKRVVFGRPIGQNQGVQFPIAKAYMNVLAAASMRDKAAELFDSGGKPGPEANMAKYLASEASWEAANAAMTTFGGYGYAVDYGIERKFRESRLEIIAPVSNNLVLSYLAEHVLGMPRSY